MLFFNRFVLLVIIPKSGLGFMLFQNKFFHVRYVPFCSRALSFP